MPFPFQQLSDLLYGTFWNTDQPHVISYVPPAADSLLVSATAPARNMIIYSSLLSFTITMALATKVVTITLVAYGTTPIPFRSQREKEGAPNLN